MEYLWTVDNKKVVPYQLKFYTGFVLFIDR